MNVFLLQPGVRSLLLLCLLAGSISLFGQGNGSPLKNIVTSVNVTARDTVSGVNLDLNEVSPIAQHGNVNLVILTAGGGNNPFVFEVQYQPDPGFVGVDTFTLEFVYTGTYPFLIYRGYRVSVYPSLVNARPDYAVTTAGNPVTINVLANDSGTNGPLSVTELPLVNNGTAYLSGNNVVFTPTAGYTGIAHVNYTVCDVGGSCKTAPIHIGVNNMSAPVNDTLRIATAKNTPLTIPLSYNGYTLFQSPANGTVMLQSGQAFRYTPNLNFTGSDQFVLANSTFGPTVYKTVSLDVLNTPTQNTMAMDDYVFTPKNTPITFNVRDNDIGNLLVKSWVVPANLPGTVTNTTAGGNVKFTPNANFSGVATFYYRIGNMFAPDIEMGAVNVIVGNMNPSAGTFDLTTPKATPMVINYQIPFIGFDFSILDAPDHGVCSFFPGFSSQNINGQTISGNNLLIYTPNASYVGVDEFEVNYCVTANGQCQSVKVVANVVDVVSTNAPYCLGDCVWTGDINNDGIVNNRDLLPLGYCVGLDGTLRPDAALEWYGQFADNWDNPYTALPMDLKHADTDGNGVVTSDDTLAIGVFYGQTHNLVPNVPATTKGLPFFLNVLTPNPGVGDLVEVEVSLGSAVLPVTNLYGFTFDVSLSPSIVDSALQMQYYDNSWLNLSSPHLWMSENPRQGRLESAFTRTAGLAGNGYGVIGKFDFIVIDIIDGAKGDSSFNPYFTITLDAPTLMTGDGQTVAGNNISIDVPLHRDRERSEKNRITTEQDFIVYPSPARDRLEVHLNGDELMESLMIYDASGQQVYADNTLQTEHASVDVQQLSNGFYVAKAVTSSGQVVKKFQIMR